MITLLFMASIGSGVYSQQAPSYMARVSSFQDDVNWMRNYMNGLMKSNRGQLDDGTTVFYADGSKHYNLIFTRGFGYIYEFAGDLIAHDDAKEFLEYTLAGQRADGCIPDRVNSDRLAI